MKFLIIGGGPVGLFLAIKLLEWGGKDVEIKLYEKRESYKRKQIVLFQPYLLKKTMPEELMKRIGEAVCHGVRAAYDNHGFCFDESLAEGHNLTSIVIKDLEEILMKYLVDLGKSGGKSGKGKLEIIKKQFRVGGSGSGEAELKWADFIVGAGGSKSYIRREVMKADFVEHDNFKSYGLAMTFEDKSNPAYFIKFDDKLKGVVRRIEIKEPSIAQHRKRFFRSRGKLTYLGLQMDPDEFEGVFGMGLGSGGVDDGEGVGEGKELKFKKLPSSVKKTVKEYLDYHGCKPVKLDDVDVWVFKIKLAHSETYARIKDGKPYFLIGDAAIESHFFTAFGINSGFAEVQNFIDIIENYRKEPDGMERSIDNYNYLMNQYREENIMVGMDATLPFRQIREICHDMSIENLTEMAQKEGFKKEFGKLSKNEMCIMLARHLLEKYKHMALLPVQ